MFTMQIAIQTEKKLTKPASQPCCSPALGFITPQTSIQVCLPHSLWRLTAFKQHRPGNVCNPVTCCDKSGRETLPSCFCLLHCSCKQRRRRRRASAASAAASRASSCPRYPSYRRHALRCQVTAEAGVPVVGAHARGHRPTGGSSCHVPLIRFHGRSCSEPTPPLPCARNVPLVS